MFIQGLKLLDFFYKQGISHGHINATNLRIKDDYSLCLTDFATATFLPGFAALPEHKQQTHIQHVRGFNREIMSEYQQAKILRSETDSKAAQDEFCDDFTMRELLQADWQDFIAAFYFAKQSLVITDQRIASFLEQIDA